MIFFLVLLVFKCSLGATLQNCTYSIVGTDDVHAAQNPSVWMHCSIKDGAVPAIPVHDKYNFSKLSFKQCFEFCAVVPTCTVFEAVPVMGLNNNSQYCRLWRKCSEMEARRTVISSPYPIAAFALQGTCGKNRVQYSLNTNERETAPVENNTITDFVKDIRFEPLISKMVKLLWPNKVVHHLYKRHKTYIGTPTLTSATILCEKLTHFKRHEKHACVEQFVLETVSRLSTALMKNGSFEVSRN